MKHNIIIKDLTDIERAAKQFLEEIGNNKLIAFYAPMGSGKTTFTTALCKVLGVVDDEVGSPTFSIINEYILANGDSMYHFDFYRLENAEDAFDIGFYDYIDSGNLCIMEWPENIESILPDETLKVEITVDPENQSRLLTWED